MMAEKYWDLSNFDLFSQLSPEDVQYLEANSRTRKFKRGEPIYLPSQVADGVLLIAKGRVKICHLTPDGKQSILNFIDSGEIFGELSLLGTAKREEFAEASEATSLVLIPKPVMLTLIGKYPLISLGITKLIGQRRLRIERRLRNLLFRSNRERVIHLLLEMTEKYGQPTDQGLELGIKLSHQELASIIGSTRETVTVMLGHLQSEGKLKIARRKITIFEIDKLRKEVNQPITQVTGIPVAASYSQSTARVI